MCPNHRGSAGKIFSRRVRKGANRAARALRLAGGTWGFLGIAVGEENDSGTQACGGNEPVQLFRYPGQEEDEDARECLLVLSCMLKQPGSALTDVNGSHQRSPGKIE